MDHAENKIAEFSEAHNGLVDAHNKLEDDFKKLATKLADIEDRNRRNNVKIRCIPESVTGPDLIPYIQQMLTALIKPASKRDLIIDRAHRFPKPKGIPASAPRNVIMRLHFFHVKEALMRLSRENSQLLEPYQKLKFYPNLSQFTIQAQKSLQPVTSALRQHNIPYCWGFPTKLLVTRNGITQVISSIADSYSVLKNLDIPFSPPPHSSSSPQATKILSEWAVT